MNGGSRGEGVKAPKLLINLSTIKASETAILLHVHVHVDYNGFYPHRSRMVDHIGDLLGVAPQRGNDLLRVLLEDHGILVCSTCMYVGEGRGGEGRGGGRRGGKESTCISFKSPYHFPKLWINVHYMYLSLQTTAYLIHCILQSYEGFSINYVDSFIGSPP